MMIYRKYNGGSCVTAPLCTVPKGGVHDDLCKSDASSLPLGSRRHPDHRERHDARAALAGHAVGADHGPISVRQYSGGNRGRRGHAHADGKRNASPQAPEWMPRAMVQRRNKWFPGNLDRQCKLVVGQRNGIYGVCRRQSAPQQHAAVSQRLYVAAHGVNPERGCAA